MKRCCVARYLGGGVTKTRPASANPTKDHSQSVIVLLLPEVAAVLEFNLLTICFIHQTKPPLSQLPSQSLTILNPPLAGQYQNQDPFRRGRRPRG